MFYLARFCNDAGRPPKLKSWKITCWVRGCWLVIASCFGLPWSIAHIFPTLPSPSLWVVLVSWEGFCYRQKIWRLLLPFIIFWSRQPRGTLFTLIISEVGRHMAPFWLFYYILTVGHHMAPFYYFFNFWLHYLICSPPVGRQGGHLQLVS